MNRSSFGSSRSPITKEDDGPKSYSRIKLTVAYHPMQVRQEIAYSCAAEFSALPCSTQSHIFCDAVSGKGVARCKASLIAECLYDSQLVAFTGLCSQGRTHPPSFYSTGEACCAPSHALPLSIAGVDELGKAAA